VKLLLKIFGILFLGYGALLLGAHAFEILAFRINGIQASDLDYNTYRTPDPDPSSNFYSVLEYDFSPSNRALPYSPKGLQDHFPVPGVMGKKTQGNSLPWPWNPDFSLFFDPQTIANDGLERIKESGSNFPEKMPDLRAISAAKTPQEVCEVLVSPFHPFLNRLCSGLASPESINPLPYPNLVNLDTPQLGVMDLIRTAKLMALESLLGLGHNPPRMSVEPILVNLRLAQGLLDRPIYMINHIAGLAITGITLPVIWKGCEASALATEDLIRISKQLAKLDPVKNSATSIMSNYSELYQILLKTDRPLLSCIKREGILGPILIPFWRGLLVLEVAKIKDALGQKTEFKTGKEVFQKNWQISHFPFPGVSKMMTYYNETAKQALLIKLASLDLTLELYRRKTGFLPESLGQLVPGLCRKLPLDPFSGKNFGYKKTGPNEFILYSSWVDQKDDGGTPLQIPNPPPPNMGEFLFFEAKGDFVWPQHHAGKN